MDLWRRRGQHAAGKRTRIPQPPPASPAEEDIRLVLGVPLGHPENVVTEFADVWLDLMHDETWPHNTDTFIIQSYL